MKYFPSQILQSGIVADPKLIDGNLYRAVEIVNGNIDSLDLGVDTVLPAQLQAESCNHYNINDTPFGSGVVTLTRSEVNSRDWVYPTDASLTFTAPEEGSLSGGLEFTVKNYSQNLVSRNYGWQIGVFIDGDLAGCIDRNLMQMWGSSLPFFALVTKGDHILRIGVRCLAYSASLATNPDDVLTIYPSQLWWRIAIR